MDRYDWDWNRGYDRPWYGRRYRRDFDQPRGWSGYGYGGPPDRPWRGDELGGGYGWRSRDARDRGPQGRGWYGADRSRGGRGYGDPFGGPPEAWGGGHGGYDRATGGGYGWMGGYDRFRAPFQGRGPGGYATEYVERFEIDYDDYDDDLDEDYESDLDWADDSATGWGAEPGDPEISRRVWQNLLDDGFVDAKSIQISVDDRVVTLRGEVGDYMEARYAWDDAWEAEGVRGVISKLTVRGEGRQESPAGAAKKAASTTAKKASRKKEEKKEGA